MTASAVFWLICIGNLATPGLVCSSREYSSISKNVGMQAGENCGGCGFYYFKLCRSASRSIRFTAFFVQFRTFIVHKQYIVLNIYLSAKIFI